MNAAHYDYERLRELREEANLSQEQVAQRVKKKRLTIHRAETGRVASYNLLCDLAKVYRVPVVSILRPIPQKTA